MCHHIWARLQATRQHCTQQHLALMQDVHFAAVVVVPQQPVVRRQQEPVGAGARPERLCRAATAAVLRDVAHG